MDRLHKSSLSFNHSSSHTLISPSSIPPPRSKSVSKTRRSGQNRPKIDLNLNFRPHTSTSLAPKVHSGSSFGDHTEEIPKNTYLLPVKIKNYSVKMNRINSSPKRRKYDKVVNITFIALISLFLPNLGI